MRSEIPPPNHMITNTIDSHQNLSQTKTSQSYKFKKIAKKLKFGNFARNLTRAHLLKLLDKMYKYEVDPTRTVGATERIRDAERTDGRMETNISPNNLQLHCAG